MARETKGSCKARLLGDGTHAFDLRFQVNGERESLVLHERPACTCGCGGGWDEAAARSHLGNVMAEVRLGIWERPQPPAGVAEFGAGEEVPIYGAYGEWWLEQKIAGVIGDRPLADNTAKDYRNCLRHLTAFFGPYPLDEIDADLNLTFKAQLLKTAKDQRDALAAGADLRDRRGRRLRPLGPAQIANIFAVHRAILEAALEDRHVAYNSARGKRLRVKVPKPKRTFLEMDELSALLDAAERQDAAMLVRAPARAGATATAVANLASKGLAPGQIATEIGRARSTVTYHLRRLGSDIGRGYIGRRAICEVLGRSGPRVGELIELRIGQVRLHDPEGARFRVPDAKTETGVRDVEISPVPVEVLIAHIDRLRRLGQATGPDAYLFPNLRGGPMTRKRVGQIIREAAEHASERLSAKGVPPLPHTTAHTLRRTYISIALIANNWDVKFVMDQVGHADSTMTMDVYAQMEKRYKRSHGVNFDRLVSDAREQVKALPERDSPHPYSPRPVTVSDELTVPRI
jgi:integrase